MIYIICTFHHLPSPLMTIIVCKYIESIGDIGIKWEPIKRYQYFKMSFFFILTDTTEHCTLSTTQSKKFCNRSKMSVFTTKITQNTGNPSTRIFQYFKSSSSLSRNLIPRRGLLMVDYNQMNTVHLS